MTHIDTSIQVPEPDIPAEDIAAQMFGASKRLIARLDDNCIRNLPTLREACMLDHMCLFRGTLSTDAGDAAPWLVELRPADILTRQSLNSAGSGKKSPLAFREVEAGIFFKTTLMLAKMCQHLRRFLRCNRRMAGPSFSASGSPQQPPSTSRALMTVPS